jgi:hypothetical protein
MGYKGRLCLGAIDTRQNTFPLHIGFHRGHEAHTGKKFFFMTAFGASIHIPFTHTGSPPFEFQYSIPDQKKKPRIGYDPGFRFMPTLQTGSA